MQAAGHQAEDKHTKNEHAQSAEFNLAQLGCGLRWLSHIYVQIESQWPEMKEQYQSIHSTVNNLVEIVTANVLKIPKIPGDVIGCSIHSRNVLLRARSFDFRSFSQTSTHLELFDVPTI